MTSRLRLVEAGLAVWTIAWIVAAVLVVSAVGPLEDGAKAVVEASDGLHETSRGLGRAARGLHETGDALGLLGPLPFVEGDPGAAVERIADDVDRFAVRVSATARDARATGTSAQEGARTLAIVLGLAIALAPTVPVLAFFFLLRPLIAQQLQAR